MNVQNSRNGEPQREQVIHLNPGDEIATIRDKIQWAGAPRVVLYVPRRNKALRDKMNLKLVQRAPILPGQMVIFDALHTQHKTVAQILYDKGADYLLPIKGNQETLLKTAQQLLPESLPPSTGAVGNQSRSAGTARPADPRD